MRGELQKQEALFFSSRTSSCVVFVGEGEAFLFVFLVASNRVGEGSNIFNLTLSYKKFKRKE